MESQIEIIYEMEIVKKPETVGAIKIPNAIAGFSAAELTKYRRNVNMEPLRQGLKQTHPCGSQEEANELEKLHDLKKQISAPRIERLGGRALAEWDAEQNAVRVIRKDGKFGNFGYGHNGHCYLENFEAIFLLELGRLQLEYKSQLISVEQAYVLLLGESASVEFHEYLVYSNLMRVGYILIKHKNNCFSESDVTPNDCIWALLLRSVRRVSLPNQIVNSPHYNKIKQSMEEIEQRICNQKSEIIESQMNFNDFKRKLQATTKRKSTWDGYNHAKCRRLEETMDKKSFLDFLKDEAEYKKFQNLFQKLDIVHLKSKHVYDESCKNLKINFDLYLHSDGFKKSAPKTPNFRLILLQPNENFPSNAAISKCYEGQQYRTPLLIVSISDSKHIQAFIYFFT